jgi:hypothetical protein
LDPTEWTLSASCYTSFSFHSIPFSSSNPQSHPNFKPEELIYPLTHGIQISGMLKFNQYCQKITKAPKCSARMQNGHVAILFVFFQDMFQEHDSHLNLGGKKGFG